MNDAEEFAERLQRVGGRFGELLAKGAGASTYAIAG